MTGRVVISEVDGLMNVVLSEPKKKRVYYVDLVGTTEYITLQAMCRTDRGRYNRVQTYFHLAHKIGAAFPAPIVCVVCVCSVCVVCVYVCVVCLWCVCSVCVCAVCVCVWCVVCVQCVCVCVVCVQCVCVQCVCV